MPKKIKILIIICILLFVGIIIFNTARTIIIKRFFANYKTPAVAVSATKVKTTSWHSTIPAVGNFTAFFGVDVNSQIGGNVVKIHIKSGDVVAKDQPLIDLDDTVEQATLAFDQADLKLQQLNYQRQLNLLKHNATSAASADDAHAMLLKAEANVDKTQAIINQKHIRAPFAGNAGILQADLGQYISPGLTPIVTLQSLDPIYLDFYLPEQSLNQLTINQPIVFTVEHNPNMQFNGKIFALNSKIDANTHNIKIRAILPNCSQDALKDPTHSPLIKTQYTKKTKSYSIQCNTELNQKNHITKYNFIPGMFANINILLPEKQSVIVLPTTALSFSLYGNSVFVIDKNNTVHRVFVTTGEQRDNYTVITSGLTPGQIVVSAGELKLEDGTRVVINNDIKLPNHNPEKLSP